MPRPHIQREAAFPGALVMAVLLAAASLVACGADDAQEPERPPNLVLIILDTLRADRLSSYGYPAATSPALDRLAAEGVRFERVLSQSSWTRPSIGSLLTSRYPRELGLYRERNEILDDEFATLAEHLQQHGYRTIGLTANPNINTAYNFHQGFDHYVDSDVAFRWMEEEAEGRIADPHETLAPASVLLESAVALARDTEPRNPVYLQVNLMDVHMWSNKRAVERVLRPEYRALFRDHPDPTYLQLTRQLTDDVAAFIQAVRELPEWQDTLFAIVSDHGEGLSDHPDVERSRRHGVLVYQSQLVVPWLLLREGWQPAARVVPREVRLLEVLPTLVDLLGLPPLPDVRGVSLRPLLEGRTEGLEPPSATVAETEFRGWEKIAVYTDEWEYIENRVPMKGLPAVELQARGTLENGGATDRSGEHAEVVESLATILAGWEAEHPKRAPTPARRALGSEEQRQLEAIGYLDPAAEAATSAEESSDAPSPVPTP